MMLIFLTLIGWSATSVASVMAEVVVPSTYDYTISKNTDMASTYIDKSDERGGFGMKKLLTSLYPDFEALPKDHQLITLDEMEIIQKQLYKVTSVKNIFAGHLFNRWKKRVQNLYKTELVDLVVFKVLTYHYKRDVALTKALVPGRDKKFEMAKKMLGLQIDMWKTDGLNGAQVFDILNLQQSNPFESPVLFQWEDFMKAKYHDKYFKEMFDVLTKRFSKEALPWLLGAKSKKNYLTKQLTQIQIAKWARDKIPDENLFKLLQLDQMNGNPLKSPLYSMWDQFLREKYTLLQLKQKTFDILEKYVEGDDNLTKILAVGEIADENLIIFARNLINFQIPKWIRGNKSEKQVFELLQLSKINSNPLDSPVFQKWVEFVQQKYEFPYIVMFDRLLSHFKNENALVDALNGEYTASTKKIAQNILDYHQKQNSFAGEPNTGSMRLRRNFDLNEPLPETI